MYKQVVNTLAAVSLFGMLASAVVQAQSDTLVANIPFAFNVGKATLPSGEYRVKPVNTSVLMIQSKDGHQAAIAMTIGVNSSQRDWGKLIFNRYGTQYFLSKICSPGRAEGRELLKSRSEVEIAKNTPAPEATTVAVKTP